MLDSRSPRPLKTHATADPLVRLQLEQALQRAKYALAWERIWPTLARLLTVGGLFLVASWAGLWLFLPTAGRAVGLALFALLALASLAPLISFRWPNRNEALAYIKWFATLDVQKKWWALGGYSCHKGVLNDASFKQSAPFAGEFLTAMDQVVDFWAEPSYAQLLLAEQKRIHDFVVADKGTAKEALDGLVADWKKVFKEDGKLK